MAVTLRKPRRSDQSPSTLLLAGSAGRYDEIVTANQATGMEPGSTERALFDATPDGVLIVDARGLVVRANRQAAELFATTVAALEGLRVEDLMPKSVRSTHQHHRQAFAAHPRTRQMGSGLELKALRGDGSTFPVDIALGPLEIDGEPYVVVSIRNILERQVTERELRLALERIAILEDRERIARDLHDTVIQNIFASGLGLQAILARVEDPEIIRRIETTIEGLDGSITRLRDIIFDLRRPTEGGRLTTAIDDVVRVTTDLLGFEPHVTIEGDISLVPPRVEEHLIPTLREALTNVAKHAAASSVEIRLNLGSDVVLVVDDDGKGLANASSPGFGFTTMKERAARLGGSCIVQDQPEGGTRVVWTVPTERQDGAELGR